MKKLLIVLGIVLLSIPLCAQPDNILFNMNKDRAYIYDVGEVFQVELTNEVDSLIDVFYIDKLAGLSLENDRSIRSSQVIDTRHVITFWNKVPNKDYVKERAMTNTLVVWHYEGQILYWDCLLDRGWHLDSNQRTVKNNFNKLLKEVER